MKAACSVSGEGLAQSARYSDQPGVILPVQARILVAQAVAPVLDARHHSSSGRPNRWSSPRHLREGTQSSARVERLCDGHVSPIADSPPRRALWTLLAKCTLCKLPCPGPCCYMTYTRKPGPNRLPRANYLFLFFVQGSSVSAPGFDVSTTTVVATASAVCRHTARGRACMRQPTSSKLTPRPLTSAFQSPAAQKLTCLLAMFV